MSSSLLPSNYISCLSPSYTDKLARDSSKATALKPYYDVPTISIFRLRLYEKLQSIGPKVLAKLLTLCPMPCTVPSTLGCGVQLLIRMVCAGNTNVRPATWRAALRPWLPKLQCRPLGLAAAKSSALSLGRVLGSKWWEETGGRSASFWPYPTV